MVEWRVIGPDPAIRAWADAAAPQAEAALRDQPRRAGGTWALGLDLLGNDADGTVAGVPLPWDVSGLPREPLHRAQLSAVYPGYPQDDPALSDSANRYARTRDAAHLDGLLAMGPDKRRMVREPHGWILGLPLTECREAPLVVWEGSVAILRRALARVFDRHPRSRWCDVDVTDAYTAARREVFATCRRIELPVVRGQATVLHRLCLHGVAPWTTGAGGPEEGRIIAYFRPQLASVADWVAGDGQDCPSYGRSAC